MKMIHGKRLLSGLIAVLILVCLMPVSALATPKNSFVLVVETEGGVIVPPEYVTYSAGQNIGEALLASGHTFGGIEDGIIHTIDGVTAGYTRGDEDGSYDLFKAASEITHFRFSENVSGSAPSEGLMLLMTAMADYLLEEPDVQAAAKTEYDEALEQFVGITSDSAKVLAKDITDAVNNYKASLSGTAYAVTFTDGSKIYTSANYPGVTITAVNEYGKSWTETTDGVLSLPKGSYNFALSCDGLRVEGSVKVSSSMTVKAALPKDNWLLTGNFRLSGSYNSTGNSGETFNDDEFALGTWSGRNVTCVVPDTFNGTIYTHAEYNTSALSSAPGISAIYTNAVTGEETEYPLVFDSYTTGPINVLGLGSDGTTVIYRLSSTANDEFTYSQDYIVRFDRRPTLKGITVIAQVNGQSVDQAPTEPFNGNKTSYTYKVLDSVTAVTVTPAGLNADYAVTVNGKDAANGVTVNLDKDDAGECISTDIKVCVSSGGYETAYTITVQPGEGKNLNFVTSNADITVEVVNSNGVVMPYIKFRESSTSNRYQYTLVPGETYSYVATLDTYYHVKDDFKLEEVANSTINVTLKAENKLTDLALGIADANKNKGTIALDSKFSASDHSYVAEMDDTESVVYLWAKGNGGEIDAIYNQIYSNATYHDVLKTVAVTSGNAKGVLLQRVLLHKNPYGNTVTVRISEEDGGMTYYQDYVIDLVRNFTLKDITAVCGGSSAVLVQKDGTAGYDTAVREYDVTVPLAAQSLELYPVIYERSNEGGWNTCYGEDTTGYAVSVNGTQITDGIYLAELDGTINTQTVTFTVINEKVPERSENYVINILKSPPVYTTFSITPSDALLSITEVVSGNRIWPDNGQYMLCENFNYDYTLTKYGYVGQSGTIEVTRNNSNALVLKIGSKEYAVSESSNGGSAKITMTIAKAPENESINTSITSQWSDFRGDADNNAATSAPIPTAAEDGTLYWANKIGEGYDSNAVGSPILADGCVITYSGNTIYRVDTVSGEILATGTMDHKSSFAITPPTYYEGMVFVALSNGTVQAFNARTLESLWMYVDPLGGQPNSPITVKNGYLYTGFWNQENQLGNFVCMTITDEDPTKDKEAKCSTWYYTHTGGFYWAGAYASNDYVIVGSDDGKAGNTNQSSVLYLFSPKTGEVLDTWTGLDGDIRSTVSYDSTTNAHYFTSKGGTFYSVQVSNGRFTNKWSLKLGGMSTSTPVIYNGRAYVGIAGEGQFSAYSGHAIVVIELSKKAIAYSVPTQGYPQTSGLLTSAYGNYVYIYFFDNMTPGKLRVLRDKAGQTQADYLTYENGMNTAYALFTPTGDQQEYAICSPIVDEYGTIYFKNDSAHLMAFGSSVVELEITSLPNKTNYAEGEKFDPAGMTVIAKYANGKTRDVTNYVTYSTDALTAENAKFTVTFPYVMYHNQEDGTSMKQGVVTTTPTAVIDLTFGDAILGDADGDGDVDKADAQKILDCEANGTINKLSLAACDVSGDGKIDSNDAVLIAQHVSGMLESFSVNEVSENED